MIEKTLAEMLRKDVNIFLNEYEKFLSHEQLEVLKSIDYGKIIKIEDTNNPFGCVMFGNVYLSSISSDLIISLSKMEGFNSKRSNLSNKNLSSYLKYMCENGYSLLEYFGDILMYFVFKLVIKDDSGFTNGLINQEIKYLSIKYSIRCANLYAREEMVVGKISPILKADLMKKILFMDKVTRFKFLSENMVFRYAKLVNDVDNIIEGKYSKLNKDNFDGLNGFLDYTDKYDHLSYADAYNYILDFKIENNLVK